VDWHAHVPHVVPGAPPSPPSAVCCVSAFSVAHDPAARSRAQTLTLPPSGRLAATLQATLTLLPLRCLRALLRAARARGKPAAGGRLLAGHQLYDVVCTCLLVSAAGALTLLRPGYIYYWMKDITSEFLKTSVLFNALEILDKARAGRAGGFVVGGAWLAAGARG
jgi:hypothetical protein